MNPLVDSYWQFAPRILRSPNKRVVVRVYHSHFVLNALSINGMRATRSEATEDEIAVCAYFIWEQESKPVGRAPDHWLQAELQLARPSGMSPFGIRRANIGRSSLTTRPLHLAEETDGFLEPA